MGLAFPDPLQIILWNFNNPQILSVDYFIGFYDLPVDNLNCNR
jgi:hypothetical protein